MKPKFLVSHPTGNNFVRALVEELLKQGNLEKLFTTIGFGNDSVFQALGRRVYNIPNKYIERKVWGELFRLANPTKGDYKTRISATDKMYEKFDKHVSFNLKKHKPDIVHSYEDCSYRTFIKARDHGIVCSYELPIAHWMTTRRLLSEEAERYPDWAETLENKNEPEEKLIKKDKEIELANCIICPSNFVLDSIPQEIREKKVCLVSPFGSPKIFKRTVENSKDKKKVLKILFVGSMTQRKGLADIFSAMKLLSGLPIELSILGKPAMQMEFYRKRFHSFKYFPPCTNYNVRKIMSRHDALLMPSIVEGRALVQQEALSCGLPIITTSNAGGEDLIDEAKTGFLIPVRSPNKIAEKISLLFDSKISRRDRIEICQKKAAEYSWGNYARGIISQATSIRE